MSINSRLFQMISIRFWWPFQEAETQPENGRYRLCHVIETEVQKDEVDDEGETIRTLAIFPYVRYVRKR